MKQQEIQIPPYLKPGDKIGICATARKVSSAAMEEAAKIPESWGMKIEFSKNLFGDLNQFSGTDAERAEDLQHFLDDPEIKAVFSARGGYGTMRIIDKIDFTAFKKNPKWIVGYSDITVLHSHIHTHCNTASLHATMPVNFERDLFSTGSVRNALMGIPLEYQTENETAVTNRPGKAEGQLIGGNLSLLYAMLHSDSDIDTNGKILFLEDLDEYLYHIDRMVLSLKRAGKFNGIKGLIVGGMNEMKDNEIPFGKNAEEIIAEHVERFDFPVCYGFPAGHDIKNYALPFGKTAVLNVGDETTELTFL
ncbi:MAG: LD-carboxypeptidase [Bacteroidota bacterium]|nr:LD-carboxypeptidase [Bacteroidota bacterium]